MVRHSFMFQEGILKDNPTPCTHSRNFGDDVKIEDEMKNDRPITKFRVSGIYSFSIFAAYIYVERERMELDIQSTLRQYIGRVLASSDNHNTASERHRLLLISLTYSSSIIPLN